MVKKVLSMMLLTVGIILSSQIADMSKANAADVYVGSYYDGESNEVKCYLLTETVNKTEGQSVIGDYEKNIACMVKEVIISREVDYSMDMDIRWKFWWSSSNNTWYWRSQINYGGAVSDSSIAQNTLNYILEH